MANVVITPSVFDFQQVQIRTAHQPDGSVWFAVKDVCAILGLTWSGATLKTVPKCWQGMLSFNTPCGVQRLRVVSEPGLYKLAFRSNKTEADAFTNWVASEVLPTIRKTGKYEAAPKALPKPKQLALPVPERRNTPYSDLAFTAGNDILDAMDLLVKAMGKIMPLSANEESLTGGSMASLAHKMTSNAVSSIANVHALLIRVSRSC